MRRPEARRKRILSKWIGEELVLVDVDRKRAHCLNPSAATLWQGCDGKTSVAELAEKAGRTLGSEQAAAVVEIGLRRLAEARLLEDRGEPRAEAPLPETRREVLWRLGALSLLPAITTIVLPAPAQAQSMLPDGSPCTSSSQCASGCCSATQMTCKPGGGNCL